MGPKPKWTAGRVIEAMTILRAAKEAGINSQQVAEWVGVTPTAVEAWWDLRSAIDGSYIEAVETKVAPRVQDVLKARRVHILAQLDKDGVTELAARAVSHRTYGHAKESRATFKKNMEFRGSKCRPETLQERKEIIKKVKWILSETGWTQAYLAERLGVESSTVCGWVTRETCSITRTRKVDALYDEVKALKKAELKAAGVAPKQTEAPPTPSAAPDNVPAYVGIVSRFHLANYKNDALPNDVTVAHDAHGPIVFVPAGTVVTFTTAEFFEVSHPTPGITAVAIPVGGEVRVRNK